MFDKLLQVWGPNKLLATRYIGYSPLVHGEALYFWFDSDKDRNKAKCNLESLLGVVTASADGEDTQYLTITDAVLRYKDKTYRVSAEFGFGYRESTARSMWEEGNYSCDCNRSLKIQRQADPDFPELECGDEIKLEDLKIIRIHKDKYNV